MPIKKEQKTLVIDGSFICYFYHYSPKILHNEVQVQSIVRTLSSIRYFMSQGWRVFVVWDGHAQWRYDLCPRYKSERRENEELAIARQFIKKFVIPYLMRFLMNIPVTQLYSEDDEADDIAANIIKGAMRREESTQYRLLCSDSDWLQLVNPYCDWWDYRAKKIVSLTDFGKEDFYDSPWQVAECKILSGDTADTISGISGIAEKRALYLLRKYGGLEGVCRAVADGSFEENKNFKAMLSPDFWGILERNSQLIILDEKDMPKLKTHVGKWHLDEIENKLAQIGLSNELKLWAIAQELISA